MFQRRKTSAKARRFAFDDESNASLLRPRTASTASRPSSDDWKYDAPKPSLAPPTLRETLTRQSTVNLIAYTFLATHSVAYDQLLPIFMHHPRQAHDGGNTRLPFQFSGGFGLGSERIGTLFTAYGVVGTLIQFLIFPPVARRFGSLNCLKACSIAFPVVYVLTPFTALVVSPGLQQTCMFAIMLIKCFAVIFAFPCTTILMTNSALSLRVLGTLNGFATSTSALGRAAGPAIGGGTFTWGVRHGYMVAPWWMLAAIAIFGAVPVWWLVESEGFGRQTMGSDDEEDEEEAEIPLPGLLEDDGAILAGDEALAIDEADEVIDVVNGSTTSKGAQSVKMTSSSGIGHTSGLQSRET